MICNKSNYFQGHFIAVNPVHQNLYITKKQMLCDQVLLIVSVCLFFFFWWMHGKMNCEYDSSNLWKLSKELNGVGKKWSGNHKCYLTVLYLILSCTHFAL